MAEGTATWRSPQGAADFVFPRDCNATWDQFDVTTEVVTVKIWVVRLSGLLAILEELAELSIWELW